MTRTSFIAVLAWQLSLTCVLVGCGTRRTKEPVKEPADANTAETQEKALRVDLYAVQGKFGARRPATFGVGEPMHFAATVSGIQATADGKIDNQFDITFTDPLGKVVTRYSEHGEELPLKGSDAFFRFSIMGMTRETLSAEGPWAIQCRVQDRLAGQTVEATLPITLLRENVFRILDAGLYRDSEALYPVSGNVTVGGRVVMKCHVRVPRNKDGRSLASVVMSIHDGNNRTLHQSDPSRPLSVVFSDDGTRFFFKEGFSLSEAGFYRIHIEATDLTTGTTDRCDIPLLARDSPGPPFSAGAIGGGHDVLSEAPFVSAMGESPPLSVAVHATQGCLGAPRDARFFVGEIPALTVAIRGLSGNAEGVANYSFSFSLANRDSSTPMNWTGVMTPRLLSASRSDVFSLGFGTDALMKPGDYTGRLVIQDNIAQRSASTDIAMSFHDDKLALGPFDFWDSQSKLPVSPSLTVGETICLRYVVFRPAYALSHDVEAAGTILDAEGHVVTRSIWRPRESANYIMDPSRLTVVSAPFNLNRPGSFRLRHELRDLVTNETVMREIPFNVFPPPELPAKGQ